MAREYKRLNKVANYDREAAEELADALNELDELDRHRAYLNQLVSENKELYPFVWHTKSEGALALHKIEDSHLRNIMLYLLKIGRPISREIRAEAVTRNLVVPDAVPLLIEGKIMDEEEGDDLWQD